MVTRPRAIEMELAALFGIDHAQILDILFPALGEASFPTPIVRITLIVIQTARTVRLT